MASLGDELLFYSFFVVGPLGLLTNVFLLVIVSRKKELRQGEYMPFIINRSLVDIVFCLHAITVQPLAVRYRTDDPVYCTIAGAVFVSFIITVLTSEAVLAVNRYVSICHSHSYQRFYRKRNVYLMCVFVWIFGASIAAIHIADDSLGRVPGLFCSVKLEKRYLLVFLLTGHTVLTLSYSAVMFCYRKIYVFIKRHQEEINNSQSTRLREDKALLRYIGAIALLPLATDTPLAIAVTINAVDKDLIPDIVLALGSFVLFLCPLFNCLFTLFMLRPIRKEARNFLKKLFKNNFVTPVVASVAVQPSSHNF